MKNIGDIAGIMVYTGLAGLVMSIFAILMFTILKSLIFGA